MMIRDREYGLASYEVDLANRQVHVRFAPLESGVLDIHGMIEHETVKNEPEPPKPPELAPKPEVPAEDAPDEAHEAYAMGMRHWLNERRHVMEATARYEAAMRQRNGWDEWLTDPRPGEVKAVEMFQRRRGV
jgi:hypothetical protein